MSARGRISEESHCRESPSPRRSTQPRVFDAALHRIYSATDPETFPGKSCRCCWRSRAASARAFAPMRCCPAIPLLPSLFPVGRKYRSGSNTRRPAFTITPELSLRGDSGAAACDPPERSLSNPRRARGDAVLPGPAASDRHENTRSRSCWTRRLGNGSASPWRAFTATTTTRRWMC